MEDGDIVVNLETHEDEDKNLIHLVSSAVSEKENEPINIRTPFEKEDEEFGALAASANYLMQMIENSE